MDIYPINILPCLQEHLALDALLNLCNSPDQLCAVYWVGWEEEGSHFSVDSAGIRLPAETWDLIALIMAVSVADSDYSCNITKAFVKSRVCSCDLLWW